MTFNEFALANEPVLRLTAFFGIFALMAAWEAAAPRRARQHSRALRWTAKTREGVELMSAEIAAEVGVRATAGVGRED